MLLFNIQKFEKLQVHQLIMNARCHESYLSKLGVKK